MCPCKLNLKSLSIDHILPLSAGGTNDATNLQALCKPCHFVKTKSEKENNEYVKQSETESSFNKTTKQIFESSLNQVHAFVERVNEFAIGDVFVIDINKSRTNQLKQSKYDFPLFTVMDEPKEYIANEPLTPGLYYVECDQYFPMRGNGWYSHAMIDYCLSNKLITQFDIKYVLESSLTIPRDYYTEFIKYLYKNLPEKLAKLAVNSMIGFFLTKEKEMWKHIIPLSTNYNNMFYHHLTHDGTHIHTKQIGDRYYYQGFQKYYYNKEETESPLYNMILEKEAIELHKLTNIIKQHGGTILDLNTDSVSCTFPNNVIPFQTTELDDKIMINDYFFDDGNYKYKLENKGRLQNPHKQILRTETFTFNTYTWNIMNDNGTNDFSEYVNHIVNSDKSFHIDGRGGCGKSYLIKAICNELQLQDKTLICVAPTNIAARLIKGITIHKYVAEYNAKTKIPDYIFIDEISMMQEQFYKFFSVIKRKHPNVKFIIAGDFEQLLPVNDRIKDCDYKNSCVLHELCDGNRLQLLKCRRADERLFNLCDPKNIMKLNAFQFNCNFADHHLCFTNQKRIELNNTMMEKKKAEQSRKPCLHLKKLSYDNNSQDVDLIRGTPVICRKTNKAYDIMNNQQFEIHEIDFNKQRIHLREDGDDRLTIINFDEFQNLFYVAYAITIHKSQAQTINHAYTIHEWHKLDKRLRYVALSRATHESFINVIDKPPRPMMIGKSMFFNHQKPDYSNCEFI
jgi:DNA replication protein DnaC